MSAPAPPAAAAAAPTEVDYLCEDQISPPDQRIALISFVFPEGKQRSANGKFALKIRGVFPDRPAADAWVQRLMSTDPLFDVFAVDVGRWLELPPPTTEQIETQYPGDNFLQQMMKDYKVGQVQAKAAFEERKRAILQDGLERHLADSEVIHPAEKKAVAVDDQTGNQTDK